MKDPIYIVLSSDDNYAQHMGIVALSIIKNTSRPERLFFFFLDAGISQENCEKLAQLIEQHGSRYEFIRPDHALYGDIPKKRYGVAALFRLNLGTLLPIEVEKVIYLDCDVIVFDDIEKMWQLDLGENIIGAVTNLGHQPVERLNIPDGEYFNSGVLLVNLNKWREFHVGEETLTFMTRNSDRLIFPDQDGLNCVLRGRWKQIPLRWNQQPATYSMYKKGQAERSLSAETYREAIHLPGIVHYLGNNKPWDYMTFHPLKENYWAYLSHSPWSERRAENHSWFNMLKKALMLEKQIKHWSRRFATPVAVRHKGF
jgi:lipopolysaccharide biosynthesis glycosyltransferase